ncbi:MAG: hypothetical protein M1823_006930, partial [Watsoniomyces obsoletus]
EESAPLAGIPTTQPSTAPSAGSRPSLDTSSPIHIVLAEQIIARLSREGSLKSFEVKGDLQLRISDPSLTKLSLLLTANEGPLKAQFRTHPNVDKALFTSSKVIQLKDTTKRFPSNNSIGVLRWRATAPADTPDILPITFTVWVNRSSDSYTITIEYELTDPSTPLREVVVTIPYASAEPAVSSFDSMYEVTGDSLEWTIGTIDDANATGSFEFEAQMGDGADESEFFPMSVKFDMVKPFIEVDVLNAKLIEEGEEMNFEKVIRSGTGSAGDG